ncbi:Rieske 2Fe-2S domain-containing protein [soil metagenome]
MSLKNSWYIACESRALKKKPLAVTVFAQALVLWRDESGKAHAFPDRCAHRNAPLSEGHVSGGCLRCPYHGWCYDGEGKCITVPALANARAIPQAARVPSFPITEKDGYVWLWPGESPAIGTPFSFPHCDESGWTTFRMRTRFESGVEACLENFLDCPHTAHVHRGWFRNSDPREMDAVVQCHASGVDVAFQNEPVTGSLIARLLYPQGRSPQHTDRFIMPNLSRVDYEFDSNHHFIIISQCTPVSEYETEVFTVISFRYGKIGRLVRLIFEPMSRHIIRQDVDILKLHGDNVRRFGGEKYAHVETDLIGLHMLSLRRRAERHEPAPADATERVIRIRF